MNSDVTINAVLTDGTTVDVTEGVKTLYDLVINSLDWGSGFLTSEDATPLAQIGHLCGFERVDEVDRYVAKAQRVEHVSRALDAFMATPDDPGRAGPERQEVCARAGREFDARVAGTV